MQTGEIVCTTPLTHRSPDLYGTVVAASRGVITIQLYKPATCAKAFYKCGDVKFGGDIGRDPNAPKEVWLGMITAMSDLGGNIFKVYVSPITNHIPKIPPAGLQNVYLHWQDCTCFDAFLAGKPCDSNGDLGSSYPCVD
ncbi:hypothetical protein L0156_02220 [bacterium]|nr:hypothetical protein [bacterium]